MQEKIGTFGASMQEEKEIQRLNKVVAKQQKISDCIKFKQEEAQYNNEKRGEKAKINAEKVERAKKTQRRQMIQAQKSQQSREELGQNRNASLKDRIEREQMYRKEAAKLKAEELQESRDQRQFFN